MHGSDAGPPPPQAVIISPSEGAAKREREGEDLHLLPAAAAFQVSHEEDVQDGVTPCCWMRGEKMKLRTQHCVCVWGGSSTSSWQDWPCSGDMERTAEPHTNSMESSAQISYSLKHNLELALKEE